MIHMFAAARQSDLPSLRLVLTADFPVVAVTEDHSSLTSHPPGERTHHSVVTRATPVASGTPFKSRVSNRSYRARLDRSVVGGATADSVTAVSAAVGGARTVSAADIEAAQTDPLAATVDRVLQQFADRELAYAASKAKPPETT